jgi:hypothetical protein
VVEVIVFHCVLGAREGAEPDLRLRASERETHPTLLPKSVCVCVVCVR